MTETNDEVVSGDIPQTEEDADALIAKAESESDNKTGPIRDEVQKPVDTWNSADWTFKAYNKDVSPKDRAQLMQWAQLGYGANNKISELTKQLDGWKAKENQVNELHKKYYEIDEHVKQNPQFWEHVIGAWKNKSAALSDTTNPLAQTVMGLQNQLQEMSTWKQSVEQLQNQYRMQQEDAQYFSAMDEIKKAYPQIDFTTPDENGKTKEWHMLQHAIDNGIKNVKTAFRDYFHDDLVKLASEQAKEKVAKDRQKNARLGIVGSSPAPSKTGLQSSDMKGKSWSDPSLSSETILKEMGLA